MDGSCSGGSAASTRASTGPESLSTTTTSPSWPSAADAAPGLIRMQDNLPLVDYAAGGPAKPDATFRCPTGAIQWLEGEQFPEHRPRPARLERRHHA